MDIKASLDHVDVVNDAQMDPFGKFLATCSNDGTVKILEITKNSLNTTTTLEGHRGAVWRVQWAHPSFGFLLASCGSDGLINIWARTTKGNWELRYKNSEFFSGVNTIRWAPASHGLVLAAGCADGTVAIIIGDKIGKSWGVQKFEAYNVEGVNAIDWAQSISSNRSLWRLAAAGANQIQIWISEAGMNWQKESSLVAHKSWIRDIRFGRSLCRDSLLLASGCQDGQVMVWKTAVKKSDLDKWDQKLVFDCKTPIWSVDWAPEGNMLAVAFGEDETVVLKEKEEMDEKELWEVINEY